MASLIVILVYQALFNVAPTYFSELISYLSTPYLLDPFHVGFFSVHKQSKFFSYKLIFCFLFPNFTFLSSFHSSFLFFPFFAIQILF